MADNSFATGKDIPNAALENIYQRRSVRNYSEKHEISKFNKVKGF